MCELFGLSANKEVTINFTWKEFRAHGDVQPDGWGLGFYNGNCVSLFKEAQSSIKSRLAKFIKDYRIRSKIFISHIRYISVGKKNYCNTHPFSRIIGSTNWLFAHNGTLKYYKEIPLKELSPLGQTDSEYAFLVILEHIKEAKDIKQGIREAIDILKENEKEFKFNFLLSNGESLYAYYSGYNKLLYYLLRKPPYENYKISLKSEELSISLNELKARNEKAALVATEPLTDESWQKLEIDKIYEFREGDLFNLF